MSTKHTPQHTMIVISAGTYRGASFGLNVWGPMMLPTLLANSQQEVGGSFRIIEYLPISDQIQSGNGGLLGVASHVATDQRQESDEWSGRSLGQIISCKTAAVVAEWESDDQTHSNDGDDEAGSADEDAVLVAITCDTACNESHDLDGATWCGV